MMKKIILIFVIAALYSCNNNNNPQPGGGAGSGIGQQAHQHWLPNWAKDTLVGVSFDSYPYPTDVIYTESIGDTSVLFYQGHKYYVWTEHKVVNQQMQPVYEFENNSNTYNNIIISKVAFSNNQIDILTTAFNAEPARYFDSNYNTWKTQHQTLLINKKPPFPDWVQNGYYTTMGKQYLD